MNNNHSITLWQKIILNSFFCERISSDTHNKELVKDFVNNRNRNLSHYLQQKAFDDDQSNKCAIYLIKNRKGKPCFYFGLKSGLLYKPQKKEDLIKEIKKIENQIKEISKITKNTNSKEYKEMDNAFKDLKKAITRYSKENIDYTSVQALYNLFLAKAARNKDYYDLFIMDEKKEAGRKIKRINESYSGIELTFFCKNENAKKELESCFDKKLAGKAFFWKFVYKKVMQIIKEIGGEYLYLFAADNSPDQDLVTYYEDELKFKKENIGVLKPMYDWSCIFMSQKISDMSKKRKTFFDNYNRIEEM